MLAARGRDFKENPTSITLSGAPVFMSALQLSLFGGRRRAIQAGGRAVQDFQLLVEFHGQRHIRAHVQAIDAHALGGVVTLQAAYHRRSDFLAEMLLRIYRWQVLHRLGEGHLFVLHQESEDVPPFAASTAVIYLAVGIDLE